MAYTPSPSIVMLRTSPGLVVIPLSNGTRPSLFEHKREERVKRRGRRGRPNVWVGVCGKDIKELNKRPGSEVTRPRYVRTKKDTGLEDTKGCLPFFPSCQSFLPTKAWRQWGEREDVGPSLVSLICPPHMARKPRWDRRHHHAIPLCRRRGRYLDRFSPQPSGQGPISATKMRSAFFSF